MLLTISLVKTFFFKKKMSTFGREFETDWPLTDFSKDLTSYGQELLQNCLSVEKPKPNQTNIFEFLQKSNEFPIEVSKESG